MAKTFGVGFLGGGQATQAIHLPTLASMPDRFRVIRVMDPEAQVAANVAARCDAKPAAKADEILDDRKIEVVAICGPNNVHAEQVIAACQAGKKLVLCEKPLAVSRDEAARIGKVARETGTPVLVGTMHAYDPAWRAAHAAWTERDETAAFVQSSIYLPSNDVFVNQATDQAPRPPGPPRSGNPDDPAFQAVMMRAAMLGLAIHNIPLVRALYPKVGEIRLARFVPPFGYALQMTKGNQVAEFTALMPGQWAPHWRYRAIGKETELRIDFPPSYVLAGSARAEVVAATETRLFGSATTGYEAMWAHIAEIAAGKTEPWISLEAAIDDLLFALDLSDGIDKQIQALQ